LSLAALSDSQIFHPRTHQNRLRCTAREPVLEIQTLLFQERFGLKQVAEPLEVLSESGVEILKDLKVIRLLFLLKIDELGRRLTFLSIRLLCVSRFFCLFQYHFQSLKVA